MFKKLILSLALFGFSSVFSYERTWAEATVADIKAQQELTKICVEGLGAIFDIGSYLTTAKICGISYAVPKGAALVALCYLGYRSYAKYVQNDKINEDTKILSSVRK